LQNKYKAIAKQSQSDRKAIAKQTRSNIEAILKRLLSVEPQTKSKASAKQTTARLHIDTERSESHYKAREME
jgi:hypothetical protein